MHGEGAAQAREGAGEEALAGRRVQLWLRLRVRRNRGRGWRVERRSWCCSGRRSAESRWTAKPRAQGLTQQRSEACRL